MKTHNATIYHCVSCGRVVHAELKAKPPLCCGHTMAKAGGETIREGDATHEAVSDDPATKPPLTKGDTKPR